MRRILINATHQQEIRVAITDQTKSREGTRNVLTDFHIENVGRESIAGNIYKGRVTVVKKDLDGAFIDYGDVSEGLLSVNRVAPQNFEKDVAEIPESERISIEDIVHEGQEVIVQVARDPRGNKGSSLNTTINLHGQHFILKTSPSSTRISRQILGTKRTEIREILSKLDIPKDVGVVVRTSAAGKELKTLQQDINEVVSLWEAIQKAAETHEAPRLLFKDNSMVCRVLRDNLHQSIDEVLVDDRQTCDEAKQFVRDFMPDFPGRIRLYANPIPLFSKYYIEPQVRKIFDREVRLPSGGSIVFDQTEALLSIDVNTARARQHDNFQDMALNTNLEAADEIMRQLRLRDVGGLVVIDFIDVHTNEARRTLENRILELINQDRTRMKFEPLSRFGLLQIQRQRVRPSIIDSSFIPCTACAGRGFVRSVQSTALSALREIAFHLGNRYVNRVEAHVSETVSAYILKELRQSLLDIEQRSQKVIEIHPQSDLEQSEFEILRFKNRVPGKEDEETNYRNARASKAARNGRRVPDRDQKASAGEGRNTEEAAVIREPRKSKVKKRKRSKTADKSNTTSGWVSRFFSEVALSTSQGTATFFKRLFVVDEAPAKKKQNRGKKIESKSLDNKRKEQKTKDKQKRRDGNESRQVKTQNRGKSRESQGGRKRRSEQKNSGSAEAANDTKQVTQKERKPRQGRNAARGSAVANQGKQPGSSQTTRAKSQDEIERSARKPRRRRTRTDVGKFEDAGGVKQANDELATTPHEPSSTVAQAPQLESESPSKVESESLDDAPSTPKQQKDEARKNRNDSQDEATARAAPPSDSEVSNAELSDVAKQETNQIFEEPVEILLDPTPDLVVEAAEQHEGKIAEQPQDARESSTEELVEDKANTAEADESNSSNRASNDPRARKTQNQSAPAA